MKLLSLPFLSSSSSSAWLSIVLTLILYHCCLAHKNTSDILCIEREKVALVNFKHDLVDQGKRLISWGSKEDDCCRWAGIVCNILTGNVQEIHLPGPHYDTQEEGIIYFDDPLLRLSGKISPSLLSLEKLEYLDMSNNDFRGMQIPKFIGHLRNLRYLDLSNSDFSGEIPPQLGNLSKLHTLSISSFYAISSNLRWISGLSRLQNLDMTGVDLSYTSNWLEIINSLPSLMKLSMAACRLSNTSLDPPIFSDNSSSLFLLDLTDNPDLSRIILHNMTSLRKLYVSGNPFMNTLTVLRSLSTTVGNGLTTLDISGGFISSSTINHLQNMTSLVVLDLSSNKLTKAIPKSLGDLCNLRELRLSENNFGEISLLEVLKTLFDCNSSKLESLEIKSSNVSGHLPEQIGMFHNLVNLMLGENLLTGPIPYAIGQLCELETLSLGFNMLSGLVTEDHFANLTKLRVLSADENSLTLKLHSANWVPPFQLEVLNLNSWKLGTQFPLWLQLQTKLQNLYIGRTGIADIIPSWFWNRLPDLRVVDMSLNQIQGTVSTIPAKLYALDLRSNNFSGPLPKLSNNLSIFYLDLSRNSFSGSLKPLLCGKMAPTHSCYLSVSNNNLSGVIPQCWENWKELAMLNLEDNNLSGEIPSSLGYLLQLESLNMRKNKLVGKLPVSLMNLTSLRILQLAQNKLMGNIPSWLGRELTKLRILELRSNRFSGDVSFELCCLISLQVLDLAHNNLSGYVPTCFNNFHGMSHLEDVDSYITVDTTVGTYASSATIPMRGREDTYSSILGLVTMLDLSNNHFSGPIPDELMSLSALRSMSLSGNHLTGRIPEKIGDMKQIEYLDLSLNQLQGEIPVSLSSLNSLSHLNLSYNNLTGRIPTSTQIRVLDNSSFIGNRLCGPPLEWGCGVETHDHNGRGMKVGSNTTHETDWGFIISILLGFALGFWVVVGPLIINRSWRITYFQMLSRVSLKFYVICNYLS